jgi:hypothetical protein
MKLIKIILILIVSAINLLGFYFDDGSPYYWTFVNTIKASSWPQGTAVVISVNTHGDPNGEMFVGTTTESYDNIENTICTYYTTNSDGDPVGHLYDPRLTTSYDYYDNNGDLKTLVNYTYLHEPGWIPSMSSLEIYKYSRVTDAVVYYNTSTNVLFFKTISGTKEFAVDPNSNITYGFTFNFSDSSDGIGLGLGSTVTPDAGWVTSPTIPIPSGSINISKSRSSKDFFKVTFSIQ